MIRRRLCPTACIRAVGFLLAVMASRGHAADRAGIKTFDTWTATCNNLADCVAVGAQDGELVTVRVIRGAKPDAEPIVKLTLVRTDDDKTPVSSVRLTAVDGDKKTAVDMPNAAVSQDDARIVTVDLPPGASSSMFIDAFRNAASLTYKIGTSDGSFGLKGMSAALRWIDARQGRAGTATALVAKGMTPLSQVPAERPVPVVTAAPEGSAAKVTQVPIGAALKKAMPQGDDCEAELVTSREAGEGASAGTLGRDHLLVFVPCSRGAYNVSAALFFTDAKGGSPRPVTCLILPSRATTSQRTSSPTPSSIPRRWNCRSSPGGVALATAARRRSGCGRAAPSRCSAPASR